MDITHQALLVKQKMSSPHEAIVHSYTQSRYDHLLPLHHPHTWQNIHSIRLCLWHLFLTSLSPFFLADHPQYRCFLFWVLWPLHDFHHSKQHPSTVKSSVHVFKVASASSPPSRCLFSSSHRIASPLLLFTFCFAFSFFLLFFLLLPLLLSLLLSSLFLFLLLLLFQGFHFNESQSFCTSENSSSRDGLGGFSCLWSNRNWPYKIVCKR